MPHVLRRPTSLGAAADYLSVQFGFGTRQEMPRLIWILGLGGFISTMGASFVWPLNTIYIHFALGRPLAIAGLVLMLQAGSGAIGQLVGGTLYDRFGGRLVILSGLGGAGLMLLVIALVRIWPVYIGAMALLGFSYGLVDPATNALVAHAWPEGGRRGYNFLYVARNAGVAIGTALGGALAEISFALAFLANAAAALAYAAVVARFVPGRIIARPVPAGGPTPAPPPVAGQGHPAGAPRSARIALGFIAAGVALIWMSYSQWQAVISVYMRQLGYALVAYTLLWTINGVLIVVGQPLVVGMVRRWLTSLRRQMVAGAFLFTASFVLIWQHPGYPWFALGMVILTVGEMLVLPALPAAVADLAPAHLQGRFQGVLGGAMSAGRMVGPVGGGALYDRWSPAGVLAAAGALCAVAGLSFALYPLAAARRHGTDAP